MIVLVNAISIKESGALVVLHRLLAETLESREDVAWHVAVCRPFPELAALSSARFTMHTIPWTDRSPLHVKFWYEWNLPRLAREVGADVLFSQTNYLPHRHISVPSLLLIQHAGHFSRVFQELREQYYPGLIGRVAWRIKTWWVRDSVRRAALVTVQSHALARAIREDMGISSERIVVVPHGPGLNRLGQSREYPRASCWRIGLITVFGVQKNFRVLFDAIRTLVKRGHDVRLVLTLRRDIPEYQRVERDLREADIESRVENHGEVSQTQIEAVYDSLNLFVFPSLCESFGFPMVEAMARGLPIVVSDTEINREITASAARFFSPHDHLELANGLLELMQSSRSYEAASRASLARAREFSWRAAAEGTLAALDRVAGHARARAVHQSASGSVVHDD